MAAWHALCGQSHSSTRSWASPASSSSTAASTPAAPADAAAGGMVSRRRCKTALRPRGPAAAQALIQSQNARRFTEDMKDRDCSHAASHLRSSVRLHLFCLLPAPLAAERGAEQVARSRLQRRHGIAMLAQRQRGREQVTDVPAGLGEGERVDGEAERGG
eukprot:scaffold6949_cov94-Isochrysis_galbana.AAC.4